MKLLFSVDKNPLGPYNDPLFKAAVNMEDKLPLNLDKFHLRVKLLLVVLIFNYATAGMD